MALGTVARSATALTAAHAVGYAISLAEVPILARALGASAYGELLWVQATALIASILIDYGFNLSASREIARCRHDPTQVRRICGDVFLAKLMLLTIVTVPLVILYEVTQPTSYGMALAGFIYLIGFGMTPFWYFQGMERMGRSVVIEVLTRTLALAGLFLFVTSPTDVTLALFIMATGSFACTAITIGMCRREVGPFSGSISGAISQVRHSTAFFFYKSSSQLMTTAATTVLGAVAGKAAVGLFAPSEKIIKAVVGLALPISQAFYPHLSRLFVENPRKKTRQALYLVFAATVGGLLAAASLTILGPDLMSLMLGPGYEQVNALIVLMVWLIPLRLFNQTLGMAILLPAQFERPASIATIVASMLALGVGTLLALSEGALGMVQGLLIGETTLVLIQIFLARQATHRDAPRTSR